MIAKGRVVLLAALALLLLGGGTADARRYASMVVDARTGTVLHADKPDRWVYPASLTKIMTLYMVFEAIERGDLTLDTGLKVSATAARMPPSKLGLRAGERIRVEDAIMALVTKSANDVAVVIAEAIGGTESGFARLMTRRALELGLRSTTFRNASGLPNNQQRTTARDMIRLGLRLQQDFPDHYAAFATSRFSYKGTRYRNHNRLLESYAGTDGIKTGYIRASGFNLLASVERDGRRLLAVVFGGRTSQSRNDHMIALLDDAFRNAERRLARFEVAPTPRRPNTLPTTLVASRSTSVTAAAAAAGLEPTPRRRPATAASTLADLAPEASTTADPLRVRIAPENVVGTEGSAEVVYGVEVGAFRSPGEAQRAADAVGTIAPPVMANAAIEVSPVAVADGTVYRARRMGLSSQAASAICDALSQLGHNCDVVRRRGLETAVVTRDAS